MGILNLLRPRWQHSNPAVRRLALEKANNPSVLVKLATRDPDAKIRAPAVERISEEIVLAKIARSDDDSKVRAAAVIRITQSVLLEVAQYDDDPSLRRMAINKLVRPRDYSFDDHATALDKLVPHFPERLLQEVFADASGKSNIPGAPDVAENGARNLAHIAPYLPESLIVDALAAARAIASREDRVDALLALAPRLPIPERKTILCEARAAVAGRWYYNQADNLLRIAQHLADSEREAVLREAIDVAGLEDFVILAPVLSEPLFRYALRILRGASSAGKRYHAIKAFAPYLPETLLALALADVRAIPNYWQYESDDSYVRTPGIRVCGLAALAPHLPEPLLHDALSWATTMTTEERTDDRIGPYDELDVSWALEALVPHLPETLLPQASDAALKVCPDAPVARVLKAVRKEIEENWRQTTLQESNTNGGKKRPYTNSKLHEGAKYSKMDTVSILRLIIKSMALTHRQPDQWERVLILDSILHLFRGTYWEAQMLAQRVQTPIADREDWPALPTGAIYKHCTTALLQKMLQEAADDPLRAWPPYGQLYLGNWRDSRKPGGGISRSPRALAARARAKLFVGPS